MSKRRIGTGCLMSGWLLTILWTSLPATAAEIRVPMDQPTIQAAIDAAVAGDTITVDPGVWNEALDFSGKDITLRSASGAATTTLDGAGLAQSIVTVRNGETSVATLEGFTLTRGVGTLESRCNFLGQLGGAVLLLDSGLTVRDCVFTANTGIVAGGAIFSCDSVLVVEGCEFTGNQADYGAGLSFSTVLDRDLVILGSTWTGNSSAHGGGIFADVDAASNLLVETTAFADNHSSHGGAMRFVLGGGASLRVEDCDFVESSAAFGGGINVASRGIASTEILSNRFEACEAGFGGGIYGQVSDPGATLRIERCTFRDDTALGCCDAGSYIDGCYTDTDFFGGGVDLRAIESGSIEVTSCLFDGGRAVRGGGAHLSTCLGGSISMTNCTIVASEPTGLDLRASRGGSIEIANSIVWATNGAESVRTFTLGAGTIDVRDSTIEGGFVGSNIVATAPHFRDEAQRDYRLTFASLALDAGDPLAPPADVTIDLDGNPRIADGDGVDGPRIDHGAYEAGTAPECAAGTVDLAASGTPVDVLFVDGSEGGPTRTVVVAQQTPFTLSLATPPAGTGSGAYVIWAWPGQPDDPRSLAARGGRLGCTIAPTPFHVGEMPQPSHSLAFAAVPATAVTGTQTLPSPASAPWALPLSLGRGLTVTMQGILIDVSSPHPDRAAATNALTLVIE